MSKRLPSLIQAASVVGKLPAVRREGGRLAAHHAPGAGAVGVPTAFGSYLTDPDGDTAHPTGILVLTISANQIHTITRFIDPQLPRLFGLANVLDS